MFKLPNQNNKQLPRRRFSNGKEEAAPGTPLYRKKLGEGIQGEANADGTIFIDISVQPGSEEERKILTHEQKHLTDMKIGRLKYNDDWLKWDGVKYPRQDGFILYNGEWIPEGGKQFPWEKH